MSSAGPSQEELERAERESGFAAPWLERAARIVALAEELGTHPGLGGALALSGGAALHLCAPEPRRMTGDLDFTFLSPLRGEALAAEEARVSDTVTALLGGRGLPAGSRWRHAMAIRWALPYAAAAGRAEALAVDVIVATPEPLWPVAAARARVPGLPGEADAIVPDVHDAAGNKLATLFVRRRSRDLFDAHTLLTREALDPERARLAFVIAVAARVSDPRTFSAGRVSVAPGEVEHGLVPLLPAPVREEAHDPRWAARLVSETQDALASYLPLAPHEHDFVARLRDHGEIRPELLTGDAGVAERIARRPELVWHAEGARGLSPPHRSP